MLQAPFSIQFSHINPRTFISGLLLCRVIFFFDGFDRKSRISDFQFFTGGTDPVNKIEYHPMNEKFTIMSVIVIYQGIAQICLRSLFIVLLSRSCAMWFFGPGPLSLPRILFYASIASYSFHIFFSPSSSSFYAKYDIQQHNFSAFDILPRSVFSFMCVLHSISSSLSAYNRYVVYMGIVWFPAIHSFIQPACLAAFPSEQKDEHKIKTEKLLCAWASCMVYAYVRFGIVVSVIDRKFNVLGSLANCHPFVLLPFLVFNALYLLCEVVTLSKRKKKIKLDHPIYFHVLYKYSIDGTQNNRKI